MKRLSVVVLMTAMLFGCAAKRQTAMPVMPQESNEINLAVPQDLNEIRPDMVLHTGKVTEVRGQKKGIDFLATGTQTIKTLSVGDLGPSLGGNNSRSRPDDRLVSIAGELTLRSAFPDSIVSKVSQINKEYDGQLILSTRNHIEIRVAAEDFDEILQKIRDLGEVLNYRIAGQDINDKFQDQELRLENAMMTRQRLLDLLKEAKNVQEVLNVERELGRLNGSIDAHKGNVRKLSTEIQLAKIKVGVILPMQIRRGPVGSVFYHAYKGIAWLW